MAKATLPPNGAPAGQMRVILVDLAGQTLSRYVPFGVDKITIACDPIGAFLFLRTPDKDPFDGAPIFRQADPRNEAPTKGKA